ncbi:group-specific protein [Halalkalibacter urbisdiaboli]|uniref:group-specific protein n=1 Tax=Halalkalibacter urbisdiaboli TaxID=1960589 RepID=UPI000B439117|nr:group-specific protein [Halalkalibacter urbisdiaboli]
MGECKLDHNVEDVFKKLEEQSSFLPNELYEGFQTFLQKKQPQTALNEAFHLLKKYDLASVEEREQRHNSIRELFKG